MAYTPENDNAGVIESSLYATPMRNLVENKGLLKEKGMLYAGTGLSNEFVCDTNEDGTDKKIDIPVTMAIDPSEAVEGSVLIKDSSQSSGWTVDKVGNDNIKTEDVYSVGGITSSGSIIINPTTNDYSFRINNTAGGHTTYDDQGMTWSNKDGSEGGILSMPKTFTGGSSAGAQQTIATKEQLEKGEIVAKTATALQGWWRHFVTVSLGTGSGSSASTFKVFFELFLSSYDQITNMSQLITAIQAFGSPALATGAGYIGTGANIPDAYNTSTNILENRVYNVSQVVYDDHLSTKACCVMIAKTTVSNISSEGYAHNIVAMDKFSDVFISDVVSLLFS